MNIFRRKKLAHLQDDLTLGKQILIFGWEIFKVVVISLAIIIPVRYYLIKPFYVLGASMEPNFHDYEYLIINEISYRFNEPQRGEVVVFRYPLDPSQYFIKRVIGLPGETVKIIDGKVYLGRPGGVELTPLEENYLPPTTRTVGQADLTLQSDEYFLMGDNRSASLDSRVFGPVKKSAIIGKTLLRGWPIDRFGLFVDKIEYNL